MLTARDPVSPGNSDLCFEWPGTIDDAVAHLVAPGSRSKPDPLTRKARSVVTADTSTSAIPTGACWSSSRTSEMGRDSPTLGRSWTSTTTYACRRVARWKGDGSTRSGSNCIAGSCRSPGRRVRPCSISSGLGIRRRWAIANSREQAGLLLGYVKTIVERSPLLRSQLASARDDRLVFRGNPCSLRLPARTGSSVASRLRRSSSMRHRTSSRSPGGRARSNGSGRPHGRCSRSTASRDGRSGSRRRATAKTSTGSCTSRPRPQRLLDDPRRRRSPRPARHARRTYSGPRLAQALDAHRISLAMGRR